MLQRMLLLKNMVSIVILITVFDKNSMVCEGVASVMEVQCALVLETKCNLSCLVLPKFEVKVKPVLCATFKDRHFPVSIDAR